MIVVICSKKQTSMMYFQFTLLLLVLPSVSSESMKPPPGAGKRMSFKAPELDEEAQWSNHMPSTLNCEGCKAISYTINSMLWTFHKNKYPQNKLKAESDVAIALEEICSQDSFSQYGVKNVNGKTKISGPGLKASDAAGMIMGGGRWPARLARRCGELMGEFDEYDVYKMVVAAKGKEVKIFNLICMSERMRKLNSCGGGLAALLEPGSWEGGDGQSYEEEDVDEDEEYGNHDEL